MAVLPHMYIKQAHAHLVINELIMSHIPKLSISLNINKDPCRARRIQVCERRNIIDCMLDYLGAHAPALYTYDNRPLIAVSAIPSNREYYGNAIQVASSTSSPAVIQLLLRGRHQCTWRKHGPCST